MPELCLETKCRECNYHIARGGRLLCNYGNRLGPSKEVDAYFEPAQPTKIETVTVREAAAEVEKLDGLLGEIDKVKGEKE